MEASHGLAAANTWVNSRGLWEQLPMVTDEHGRPLECGDWSPLSFSQLSAESRTAAGPSV